MTYSSIGELLWGLGRVAVVSLVVLWVAFWLLGKTNIKIPLPRWSTEQIVGIITIGALIVYMGIVWHWGYILKPCAYTTEIPYNSEEFINPSCQYGVCEEDPEPWKIKEPGNESLYRCGYSKELQNNMAFVDGLTWKINTLTGLAILGLIIELLIRSKRSSLYRLYNSITGGNKNVLEEEQRR